jgi:hypothetical protein
MRLIARTFLLLCFTASVWAQNVISVRAGLISYAEGVVYLDKEPFEFRSANLVEVSKGHRLQTASGRAEVQLGPAATLWLAENGSLRMVDQSLTDARLSLEQGSIYIEIIEKIKKNRVRVNLDTFVVEMKETGAYRLDYGTRQLYVYEGKAVIKGKRKEFKVKENTRISLPREDKEAMTKSQIPSDWRAGVPRWVVYRSYVVYNRARSAQMMEQFRQRNENWRYQQQIRTEQQIQEYLMRQPEEQ